MLDAGTRLERNAPTGKAGLFGWVLFDWAAQPFYTLVVTFLFAPYFVNGFAADPAHGQSTLGLHHRRRATASPPCWRRCSAPSPMPACRANPGSPASPCSSSPACPACGSPFPATSRSCRLVLLSFAIAVIGAELATVFTNAMMPGLISGNRLGTLSGVGWAVGYVGGLVSLALLAGLVVADPNTGKTLLGLQPLIPLDPATREGDRLVGPFSAALVSRLRPAAVSVHAGPAGQGRRCDRRARPACASSSAR